MWERQPEESNARGEWPTAPGHLLLPGSQEQALRTPLPWGPLWTPAQNPLPKHKRETGKRNSCDLLTCRQGTEAQRYYLLWIKLSSLTPEEVRGTLVWTGLSCATARLCCCRVKCEGQHQHATSETAMKSEPAKLLQARSEDVTSPLSPA